MQQTNCKFRPGEIMKRITVANIVIVEWVARPNKIVSSHPLTTQIKWCKKIPTGRF